MYIIDYDSYSNEKLGIFFYDEKIYVDSSMFDEFKSYRFKLKITDSHRYFDNKLYDLYEPFENLEFIHTCNLKNYIKVEIFKPGSIEHDMLGEDNEDLVHETFDYEKLINEVVPEEFEFIKERLIRKQLVAINNQIAEPVLKEGVGEFLWLDDQSSFYGNYQLDNKEGCIIEFGKSKLKEENFDFSPNKNWNYYDIPYNLRNEDYITISKWSSIHKIDYFKSLPLDAQSAIAEEAIKDYTQYLKTREFYPYRIWLYGTDDDSWSKWFLTEKEMLKEVNWLRKMQPLNKNRDIINRGYVFTN